MRISFYYNDVLYQGTAQARSVWQACCEVLDTQGIAYTDDAQFDLVSFRRHKTFVDRLEA